MNYYSKLVPDNLTWIFASLMNLSLIIKSMLFSSIRCHFFNLLLGQISTSFKLYTFKKPHELHDEPVQRHHLVQEKFCEIVSNCVSQNWSTENSAFDI